MQAIFMMYGVSFVLIMGLMFSLWLYYLFKKNAGIVDIGWCIGFLIVSLVFLLVGTGWLPRRIVLFAMIFIWASQLLFYIQRRFRTSPPDARYETMIAGWEKNGIAIKVLLMFLFQGLILLFLTIAFLFPSLNNNPEWHHFEIVGITIWAIGVMGEYFADKQLETFKKNPKNKGKVCQKGFWKYSRHPNYFFEFVVWIGFAFFSLGSTLGFAGVISPIIILFLLLNVSGIPLAEQQAVKSKADAYRAYQKTTSIFIPWFPG